MKYAILLSGGSGLRMGASIPKQYLEVNNKPIISYTLKNLLEYSDFSAIVIVAAPQWQEFIKELYKLLTDEKSNIVSEPSLLFAIPGENRQASIINALECIRKNKEISEKDYVLIHDAVRPMLTPSMISEYFDEIQDYDGLLPVLPMKDTVYFSDNGDSISELLDRSKIFAGQAPEIFKLKDYIMANERLTQEDIFKINGSTEPAIMAGMDIRMVSGSEDNFKITTKNDLERFTNIVS